MEEMLSGFLKKRLREKISLYNALLFCFKKEKASLENMDMDSLWRISSEKDDLCSKINTINETICSAVGYEKSRKQFLPDMLIRLLPEKECNEINELYHELGKLKKEIDYLREFNMHTVNDSLKFLDEIISIITGQIHQGAVYDGSCRLNQSRNNTIMSREV